MADLPEFKIDTKGGGKSIASGIIGGIVGGAVSQGITTRGEAKRSKVRMAEAEHAAGLAKGLMTHSTDEKVRLMGAAHGHGAVKTFKTGDTSIEWQKRNDNQNTGEVTHSDTQKSTHVDPNTVSKPIEPGAQHGGSATGRVIPAHEPVREWGHVPGQLTMFDKSGRVSKGVASKPAKKAAAPKTPKQGELF